MNNLESGDLAIIVKSVDGISVGKIVTCLQVEGIHSQHGIIWLVQSSGSDLVSEYGGVGSTVHVPQDWLKKIPKDALPEAETVKELEKV